MTSIPSDIFLGCISGTSVDGLDIAAAVFDDTGAEVMAATTTPLPDELRDALLTLGKPGDDDLDLLGHTDAALGDFIGHALINFLASAGISASDVRAVGSHGQTVRHRPDASPHGPAFTMQIGDPNRIAEVSGITTVADFRRRDMAAGGQGAPLVPPFHEFVFGQLSARPVVVNIGGISNITVLGGTLTGFDTGPGNALLDAWCHSHRGTPYDKDGAWSQTGTVGTALLNAMLSDPYFTAEPPKSTGREYFHLDWLRSLPNVEDADPVDVQATLVELTAQCVTDALARWAAGYTDVVVCGGGRLNSHLLARLSDLSAAPVHPSEHFGLDGDSIEATAFAWLAHRHLSGIPGNAPGVTGATGERVLGAIYPA